MATCYIITQTYFRGERPDVKTFKRVHYAVASANYQQALYEALAAHGKLDTHYGHKKYREAKESLLKGVEYFSQVIANSTLLTFHRVTYRK
jgi:hypothetical protein